MWLVLYTRVPFFKVRFVRVPYEFGDLRIDPSLENYPCGWKGLGLEGGGGGLEGLGFRVKDLGSRGFGV